MEEKQSSSSESKDKRRHCYLVLVALLLLCVAHLGYDNISLRSENTALMVSQRFGNVNVTVNGLCDERSDEVKEVTQKGGSIVTIPQKRRDTSTTTVEDVTEIEEPIIPYPPTDGFEDDTTVTSNPTVEPDETEVTEDNWDDIFYPIDPETNVDTGDQTTPGEPQLPGWQPDEGTNPSEPEIPNILVGEDEPPTPSYDGDIVATVKGSFKRSY